MSIKDWTNKDYAQAAIDMLPDDPEMIGEFLKAQGISARGRCDAFGCPIAKWVKRWTGRTVVSSQSLIQYGIYPGDHIRTPRSVAEFIRLFDESKIRF